MKHLHSIKELQKLCNQFGEDINSEVCNEVKKSLENCPDCRIQFDSIKKVVNIYKLSENDQESPDNISNKLLKSLNLK